MNDIYNKLLEEYPEVINENEYEDFYNFYNDALIKYTNVKEMKHNNYYYLQSSTITDFLNSDFKQIAMLRFIKTGDLQCVYELFKFNFIAIQYRLKFGDGKCTFEHEALVVQWYLSLFFNHKTAEKHYRERIKQELSSPRRDSFWEDENDYVPEHFIFLKNMLASVEQGKLTQYQEKKGIKSYFNLNVLLSKNKVKYDYSPFFDAVHLPNDSIDKLSEFHLLRAKGEEPYKEDDPIEPFGTIADAIFPAEIMAWYSITKKTNPDIDYQNIFVQPFIDFKYEKEIKDSGLLEMIKVMSEFVGEDILKLGEE